MGDRAEWSAALPCPCRTCRAACDRVRTGAPQPGRGEPRGRPATRNSLYLSTPAVTGTPGEVIDHALCQSHVLSCMTVHMVVGLDRICCRVGLQTCRHTQRARKPPHVWMASAAGSLPNIWGFPAAHA